MKKSLVLAMALAMGVTASAYAANPFSDVPEGHWAYDSINQLAAAGVIEGYGDTTFGGDRLMTRYEMAQIVAKAMARGANVDKLAAEFADELDTLGVRVANLEKKADNVKITGEIRYRYMGYEKVDSDDTHDLRTRIWITGQVNDDWKYTGMLENIQNFRNDDGDEDTTFQRAYVEGKIGGINVLAGRYNAFFANGNIYDARADGVELSYDFDGVKIMGYAGKASDDLTMGNVGLDANGDAQQGGDYCGVEVTASIGDNFNAMAGYVNYKDIAGVDDLENAIWYIGADYTFSDITLSAMYLMGDADGENGLGAEYDDYDDDGWTVGLSYKGAEAEEVNSWGIFANYYDQGGQTYIAHTTDADVFDGEGFKGYGVGVNYTVAKNMVATVVYYDTENKTDDDEDEQILWADLTFSF